MATKRMWMVLGQATLDVETVVKIIFDGKGARLFASAGEALLLIAWTDDRYEVTKLKEYAARGASWVAVRTEPDDPEGLDQRVRVSAVDKCVRVDSRQGALLELYTGGVYAGQVVGDEAIASARALLGIS
jgi:hypothetical protein